MAAIVARSRQGYAADESAWWSVENVGYGADHPVTEAQLDTLAALIADTARRRGLAISRATVLTHADLNSVSRASCAFPPPDANAGWPISSPAPSASRASPSEATCSASSRSPPSPPAPAAGP